MVDILDQTVYQELLQFGVVEPRDRAHKPRRRPNRALAKLREEKRECKKAMKACKRLGLPKDAPPFVLLMQWWRQVMKAHNKLRVALKKAEEKRCQSFSEKCFRQNPWKYTVSMFSQVQKSCPPTFTKEVAEQYFPSTYTDSDRPHLYLPLPNMKRPAAPAVAFLMEPPSTKEIQEAVKKKRNAAVPGLNGVPYLPYKKCEVLQTCLHTIFKKVWKSGEIPPSWAEAYIVLLSKSERLEDPGEFRPIAITNTSGKIFFSIMAKRLEHFMLKNSFIESSTQKGFLSEVAGCTEHAFALWEALREAKDVQRSIVVAWLDLANAYGSVRHNLIQFALNWYHVPLQVQKLVFAYYEQLQAKVITPSWETRNFLYEIGLFQGCVLSTILFDCVFNLLLDFLKPLNELGYTHKFVNVTRLAHAYADDLCLKTSSPKDIQFVIDQVFRWLQWTVTLKAKPNKCLQMGLKKFDRRWLCKTYKPYLRVDYSPYDAKLSIDGKPIRFIVDPSRGSEFLQQHFKFLGRWIGIKLNDLDVKVKCAEEFREMMNQIDKASLNGLMKLWMYQHYVLSKLSWSFLIHDFNLNFCEKLQQNANAFLKKWVGVLKGSDEGILYRPRALLGLGLTSLSTHFKRMQVVKCHLLKNSRDADIRALYERRIEKESKHATVWRPTQELAEVEKAVKHAQMFPSQVDKAGIGFVRGRYNKSLTTQQHRRLCSAVVSELETRNLVSHAHTLPLNGVWTKWHESVKPFDLSWKNLIYGPGPRLVAFVLNCTMNSMPTPDLLKIMKYRDTSLCNLCGAKQCTLNHILSSCSFSLQNGRYTWRHDSILMAMVHTLKSLLQTTNAQKVKTVTRGSLYTHFVRSGQKNPPKPTNSSKDGLLSQANDWEMLYDYPHMVFPAQICATNQRPDIVIWSKSKLQVFLIELTCPAEENILSSSVRKEARYESLRSEILAQGWSARVFTVEVGARGFPAQSVTSCFRKLGLSSRETTKLLKRLSTVASKCSYTIWLARNAKSWSAGPPLELMDS
jgi:hypothetical protein